jgi:hypothetical protein
MVVPTRGYRNRNRSVSIIRVLKISGAESSILTKPPGVNCPNTKFSLQNLKIKAPLLYLVK